MHRCQPGSNPPERRVAISLIEQLGLAKPPYGRYDARWSSYVRLGLRLVKPEMRLCCRTEKEPGLDFRALDGLTNELETRTTLTTGASVGFLPRSYGQCPSPRLTANRDRVRRFRAFLDCESRDRGASHVEFAG